MPSRGQAFPSHEHSRSSGCPQHEHTTPRERQINHDYRDLYLQICYPLDNAVHWLIFLKCPGADRGTRLHSTGCYGQRTLTMELDKRFVSRSVETTHYLGRVTASDSVIVPMEAEQIPLQSCQLWVCYLMLRLERKGLLKSGTYEHYMNCYPHRRDEDFGPGRDAGCPVHHGH
jgi:hypothetical protein